MNDFFYLHLRKFLAGVVALIGLGVFMMMDGCGGETNTLTGKVTSSGKTVASGTVTIIAADNSIHQVPIRPDGTYQATGLPPGPVRLSVTSTNPRPVYGKDGKETQPPAPPPDPKAKKKNEPTTPGQPRSTKQTAYGATSTVPPIPLGPPPPAAAQWFPIPGKYANPQSSGLSTEAGGGSKQFNITAD